MESERGSSLLFRRVFLTRTGAHGACHRARIRATRWLENALAIENFPPTLALVRVSHHFKPVATMVCRPLTVLKQAN
jgi:hypothetical protein